MRLAIASVAALLASQSGAPAAAQFGARYLSTDAPKVQFFTPPPNEPVAPVIVPQREAPPAAAVPAEPARPAAPRPQAAPAGAPSGAPSAGPAAPYFVPGSRAAPPASPAAGPQATAEAFYRTYLQIRAPGVPNAAQRAKLRPFLTPAIDAALAAAEQAEKTYRAKTNGTEPPLVEGDLFASLFEGATSFTVRECSDVPPGAQCHVQLSFTDPATNQKFEWRDTLHLIRLGNGWRVNDITFGGKFLLGQTGQLSDVLQIVINGAR